MNRAAPETDSASAPLLPCLRDLAIVVAGQIVVGVATLRSGFAAVSDDDYARVVIAQKWVEQPALDPSGSSWLPLPFWLQGAWLSTFGPTLEAARALAFVLAVAAACLIYACARLVGIRAGRAVWVPLAASALPTALPLAVATVPEYPTAALVAFGAVTLTCTGTLRLVGAAALACATASRYETWAGALFFSLVCFHDAWRARRDRKGEGAPAHLHAERPTEPSSGPVSSGPISTGLVSAGRDTRRDETARDATQYGIAGVAALAFPALWLIHGATHRGSATFFVKRVEAYKAALGADPRTFLETLVSYPRALVLEEPETSALLLLVLGILLVGTSSLAPRLGRAGALLARLGARFRAALGASLRPAPGRASFRLLAFAAVVVGALVVGDVRGGAPTHHPERTLVAVWILFLLFSVALLDLLRRRRIALFVVIVVLLGLPLRLDRPPKTFAERAEEEALGRRIRERFPAREPFALATTDYGYFAVEAAAGTPGRFAVGETHDPRDVTAPLSLPDALERARAENGACFAALPLCVELSGAALVEEVGAFQIVRFTRPECSARPE